MQKRFLQESHLERCGGFTVVAKPHATLPSNLEQWCQKISNSKDYLFQDRLLTAIENSRNFHYVKRDFLHKPGEWRQNLYPRLLASRTRKILLVGHSDYSTTLMDLLRLRLRGERSQVFAQNLLVPTLVHEALRASYLPLGLTSPTNESASHQILGDFEEVSSVVRLNPPPADLNQLFPYASFDVKTSKKHRTEVERLCRELEHVKFDRVEHSRDGRKRFLTKSRRYGLVVCPRGNGHDTHRFYEALYVGALPVVLETDYSARLARKLELPHIALSNWSELADLEGLRASAWETLSQKHNLDVISFSWWSKVLSDDV